MFTGEQASRDVLLMEENLEVNFILVTSIVTKMERHQIIELMYIYSSEYT